VDAAEDKLDASENLANMIRLVRRDFGIRIEIDTTPLRKDENGLSKWHVAVGLIRYDDVDDDALAGTLIFVRSSLTGDEPADVRNYAAVEPRFPHHPTLPDQWFDEVQFESYRALGEHLAESVFEEACAEFSVCELTSGNHVPTVRRFFANVRNRWFPPPPDFDRQYCESGKISGELMASVRRDPNMGRLVNEMYPELVALAKQPADKYVPESVWCELVAINEILNTMEMAWMAVNLDGYYAHPMNRGWMGSFRRWTSSAMFQKYWPILRGEYSKDFVRFCEKTLNLSPVRVAPVRATPGNWSGMNRRLNEEFVREWAEWLTFLTERENADARMAARAGKPDTRSLPPFPQDLNSAVEQAIKDSEADGGLPLVWFINIAEPRRLVATNAPNKPHKHAPSPVHDLANFPIGLIVVYKIGSGRYESIFWMRGAYRSLGLGRAVLETEVETSSSDAPIRLYQAVGLELWDRENSPQRCRVQLHSTNTISVLARYPIIGETSADRLQRALWLNFFHDYDFRRAQDKLSNHFHVLEYHIQEGTLPRLAPG
jgi:hypothetical protein